MAIKTAKNGRQKPKIKLEYGDTIIAVAPEYASGPGWSNSILWVHIRTVEGKLRTEALQPEDQTHEQLVLFATVAAANAAMVAWTMQVVEKHKPAARAPAPKPAAPKPAASNAQSASSARTKAMR